MIDTPVSTRLARLPFPELNAFSALFEAYTRYDDALAPFYAGDYRSPDVRRAHADRVAAHDRPRDAVAEALLRLNERWGHDDTVVANIERLRDPASVAIVTGQQVGLLGGPLYTIYKTITTLQLADAIAEETGRSVVPIFWMAGGDHDFAEVAKAHVQHRNEVVPLRYTGHAEPEEGNLGPVGRLALTDQVDVVLAQLDEALVPTDFKPDVMAAVREAYAPGTTLQDAFGRLLRTWFAGTGLVLMTPDDPALKRLAAPLFRSEIDDFETSTALLQESTDRLAEAYHAQVHIQPTNLFLVQPEGRFPIDAREDGVFELRHTGETFTREALHDLLEAEPERFSPNVVLRPLMQDTLLPTLAYVGGPSEVAYLGQYKALYDEWAGLPMPLVVPRASVTLIESKVDKVLERYDLSLPDLTGDFEALVKQVVLAEAEVDVETIFAGAQRQVHEAINTLKPNVAAVDQSLAKSVEATRAAIAKELGQLQGRVVKAEKRSQEITRSQLDKARVNLMPDGSLQERLYSVLYYLNKYSPALIAQLRRDLELDTTAHQVVTL